jgi:hypothetical protein
MVGLVRRSDQDFLPNLIKCYAMKTYGGENVEIHVFLTSVPVLSEWSASRIARFTSGESAPGTHWIEGWLGPRACLDDMEKGKFLTLPGLEH